MIPATFKNIIPRYEAAALYKCNLPFSLKLAENLEEVKKRTYLNRRRLPSMITIDGGSGLGKTTLAFLIASYLEGKMIDPKQKGEGTERFLESVEYCIAHKRKVVIYDEAGDFERKATQTKANRAINRVFDVYRTYGIVVIICLPYLGKLDNGPFENQIPRLHLNVFQGNDNYSTFRAYSLVGMLWIRHNLKIMERKYPIKARAYDRVDCNFYGRVKRPPDWFQALIDKSSDAGKERELSAVMKKVKEAKT